MGKARAQTRLAAVTEEQDWYLDTPDVRLTRIFTVVLLLHAIAIGGIMAFKMVDKASADTGVTITTASSSARKAGQEDRELAADATAKKAAREAVPAETRARPAPPAPLRRDRDGGEQYKVQAGDTLPEIAERLDVSPAALRETNAIVSDNELYPGRWLDVPRGEDAATAARAEKKAETPARVKPAAGKPARPRTYEVKQGDTAWGISQKVGVSYERLMAVNGIDRPETLQIGQKLEIPRQ